jgi:Zn-dependent protease/CBS domain-containing protein
MFRYRVTILRVAGIPIRIDASWVLIALLITWSLATYFARVFPLAEHPGWSPGTHWLLAGVTAGAIFVCLVLHEMGHALVARYYGMPIRSITLFVFGGVAEIEKEPPSAWSELFVAVAGPAVSVGLGAVSAMTALAGTALGWPTPLVVILNQLALVNTVLACFNALPAFPLDGGRVLRALLWAISGNLRRATAITARMGSILGSVLMLLGFVGLLVDQLLVGLWWMFIGWYLQRIALQSYEQVMVRQILQGEPVRQFMTSRLTTVGPDLPVMDLVDRYIYRQHHELYPVMDDGRLLGYVTPRRVKEVPRSEWAETEVGTIMETAPEKLAVTPETDALEVLGRMQRTGQTRLLVMEGNMLVGIVTLKDLLAFLSLKLDLEGEDAAIRPTDELRGNSDKTSSWTRKEQRMVHS